MRIYLVAALCGSALLATSGQAAAQTLTRLKVQPPQGVGLQFLLTDGTVMCQGRSLSGWFRLTPDASGSYVDGTWTATASIPSAWHYAPDAFASAVLADGRLVILGGEYNRGVFAFTAKGAIYDPVADVWSQLSAPPGWNFVGDSPSTVLPDGRFVVGRKFDRRMAALDPATLQWTELSSTGKADFNAEEGWTLMPDGSILTVDVKSSPGSERYDPTAQTWSPLGSTVADLREPKESGPIKGVWGIYYPPGEMGPQVLRPDGSVFVAGATTATGQAHTAVYSPGAANPWAAGPEFPAGDAAGDSSAVLLPSGNVLVSSQSGTLYEFDGTSLTPGPMAFGASLMTLPTGEALVTGAGAVHVYKGTGAPQAAWAPTITAVSKTLARGSTYPLTGTQLNGLSQAAGFGDEAETATNYPIVRIRNTATRHVVYARTHDHSTMAVATGAQPVSTFFDVPAGAEVGASEVVVVANGIPSRPVLVTVQ